MRALPGRAEEDGRDTRVGEQCGIGPERGPDDLRIDAENGCGMASSPEAVRRHAAAAGLPADEVIPVADVVVVRPDPVPVST